MAYEVPSKNTAAGLMSTHVRHEFDLEHRIYIEATTKFIN